MAHVRRVFAEGATAIVVRKGDADAGAIFIRTLGANGISALLGPALGLAATEAGERVWRQLVEEGPFDRADPDSVRRIDERLARELQFDPDIWIIEIEDRTGRHFLEPYALAVEEN